WNPSRNTIDGSEELYRIAGLGCGEPAPTLDAYLNWFHPEDRGEVARTITEALAARQPFSYEARIVRPDGGIRHVHANGLVEMDATGVPKVVGTIEDVTERREKDEALLRSSALLEAEQEATPDGVLVVDEDRVVLDVNRRFVELWNIPPHLVERRSDRELLEHVRPQIKDWQSFLARVEELYRQPTALAQDEILLADGRVFERYSSPVVSPAGQYLGRVWYFRDISERKRIEAKLQQQYDQLRELDRIKDDFLHAVSHDLRTPLSSIRGYSEFLADDLAGSLSPGQREYVAQIEKGAIRLEGMVNDLLDFARIEAGTFRLDCGQTDLRALIRGVADSLRPLIEEAKLTLTVSLPETPLTANLDSERIERVLFNLLTNAIKFTERGGRIALRARAEGPHLLCEIVDTGIGIAKEDLAKLFRRFSQLDTGRNKRGGTGLGLSISKAIVEAHGGTIGVSSEPGSGSTFWFRLPVQSTVCTPSDAAGES
ncbi:MAG TPA: PAS domain-containing sensor histidine kinase, partial [Oscillatoriaceae cyanobacterium]